MMTIASTGISSQPIHHQRLNLNEMPTPRRTGSLKISWVKITARSGISMDPAVIRILIRATPSMDPGSVGRA